MIHVFNVYEHGRRYYRAQVYTSSVAFSLHDFDPQLEMRGSYSTEPHYVGGDVRVGDHRHSGTVRGPRHGLAMAVIHEIYQRKKAPARRGADELRLLRLLLLPRR